MISIIDYGLGNVKAFSNIFKMLNVKHEITANFDAIEKSSKLILPGVGSFDWAMHKLTSSGLKELLDKVVIEKKIPILGICVGMQLMANESDEGELKGLGWIEGKVKKLSSNNKIEILPHMGWNYVEIEKNNLFKGIKDPNFYFLHSYFFEPESPNVVLGKTSYNEKFASIVNKENIFGIQFHPEKSHDNGISILKNFAEL